MRLKKRGGGSYIEEVECEKSGIVSSRSVPVSLLQFANAARLSSTLGRNEFTSLVNQQEAKH